MAPLVSIKSVSKAFTKENLFEDLTLVLEEGEKTAFIGANGSGKSTLLKIIAGLESPDSGEVITRRDLTIGYVAQEPALDERMSVEQVLAVHASPEDPYLPSSIARAMGQAGFTDKAQLVGSLSGGWKKRLAIACALIRKPDLLLLDEPTNHLDIESILWLEELVSSGAFAVLCVSHDRYFIEEAATRVLEIDRRYPKGFLSVNGSYSDFLLIRSAFFEQMQSYRESLSNRVRREVDWLRKSARARTTKAKGRIQEAHKLIEELQGLNLHADRASMEFVSTGRKSKELIVAERLGMARDGRRLFENLNFVISPGTRLGVVGKNGSGKTTLLETLLGELRPTEGRVKRSWELKTAFFDQARESLNKEESLKQALCRQGDAVVFNGKELHVTSWARRFLFRAEQLPQPVKTLSGGEQARLLVARLMLQPADVLVLDEPTNDLDIPTLEVLEETLCEFEGAVILVTHDRFMLDRVCTSVIGLSGRGHAEMFADYTQWEIWHDEMPRTSPAPGGAACDKLPKSEPPAKKKLTYGERLELEGIEKKILKAEDKVRKIEKEMALEEVASDHVALHAHYQDLSDAQREVERLYDRWQELERKRDESQ